MQLFKIKHLQLVKNRNKNTLPKILCIIQLPPPVHGVSLMNSYLINSEIINRNFSMQVVNLQFAKSMDELGIFSFKKILKSFIYGLEIVKKVRTYKPGLIYFTINPTGFAFYRDVYYVFLLKLCNKHIVYHLHGKGIKKNAESNFFKKQIYKWVFKNTDVICLSERLTADIDKIYKCKPFIVPNGIEVQPRFNRERERVDSSVPQILCISNYTRNKGILELVEALAILKNHGYNFIARFVGAPFDLTVEMIEEVVNKLDLTRIVKIVGPLYGDDKFKEYQLADIFVFPTYNDVFGLVNLEAMQYALPVISTFEGSIPDIVIDNETGFLVETQNAQMLADKIALLLKDKNKRIEMGKKGYERFMNNYTLDHFITNINNTFHNILISN